VGVLQLLVLALLRVGALVVTLAPVKVRGFLGAPVVVGAQTPEMAQAVLERQDKGMLAALGCRLIGQVAAVAALALLVLMLRQITVVLVVLGLYLAILGLP